MRNTSSPCTASLPPGRERETSLGRVTSPHSSKTTTSSAFGFLAWITPLRLPKRTSSFPPTHLPSPFLYNEEKLLGKSLWLTTESVRCLESQVASFLIGAERRFDFVRPSPRPSRGTLRHRDRTAPGISEVREDPPKKTDFEKKHKKKSVPLSLFFFFVQTRNERKKARTWEGEKRRCRGSRRPHVLSLPRLVREGNSLWLLRKGTLVDGPIGRSVEAGWHRPGFRAAGGGPRTA